MSYFKKKKILFCHHRIGTGIGIQRKRERERMKSLDSSYYTKKYSMANHSGIHFLKFDQSNQ